MKRNKARRARSIRPVISIHSGQTEAPGSVRMLDLSVKPLAPSSWPSISACLIVKNEAANIRPCLASLEDLASEIIVVDTGSTDNTVELAQEKGAQVVHFQWVDDFAAARNESIKHATKEWIFWLDADDRLSPRAIAQFKAAASSGTADAYGCLVSSKTNDSGADVTEHIRLFRNGIGVQFAGSIHETVFPYVVRLGLRLALTDIQLEHTGYESPEVRREKAERNLAIIEARLAGNPGEADLIYYRGQSRGFLNDVPGLEADMRQYLALTRPSARFQLKRFWAYTALGGVLQAKGLQEEREALINDSLAEFPGHPAFLVVQSQLQMAAGRPEAAIETLQAARRAMLGPVRGIRPTEAAVERSLAEAYHALGQLDEAVRWAEQARDHEPDSTTIAYFLAKLYSEANRLEEAETVLELHLPIAMAPEPWLIMAEVRAGQKQWSEALSAVEEAKRLGLAEETYRTLLARLKTGEAQAAGEAKGAGSAARLKATGIALLRTGDHLKAAESFAAAIQAAPKDPDSYKYLAAALKALGQEEQALEAWRLATLCQVPA